MVIVEYVGGVKENHSQICLHCGFQSQDVKDFWGESGVFSPTGIVEEMCLTCYFKENKYEEDVYPL